MVAQVAPLITVEAAHTPLPLDHRALAMASADRRGRAQRRGAGAEDGVSIHAQMRRLLRRQPMRRT